MHQEKTWKPEKPEKPENLKTWNFLRFFGTNWLEDFFRFLSSLHALKKSGSEISITIFNEKRWFYQLNCILTNLAEFSKEPWGRFHKPNFWEAFLRRKSSTQSVNGFMKSTPGRGKIIMVEILTPNVYFYWSGIMD